MEEMKQTTVVMTAEEKAEFEAFQREKAKKAAEEKAKNGFEVVHHSPRNVQTDGG